MSRPALAPCWRFCNSAPFLGKMTRALGRLGLLCALPEVLPRLSQRWCTSMPADRLSRARRAPEEQPLQQLLEAGAQIAKTRRLLTYDAEVELADGRVVSCQLPARVQQDLMLKGSGFFAVRHTDAQAAPQAATPGWQALTVLSDEAIPDLTKQGLMPPRFVPAVEDNGDSTVDLRSLQKASNQADAVASKDSFLTNGISGSRQPEASQAVADSDDEDEDHSFECPCCVGGRRVVFRVF